MSGLNNVSIVGRLVKDPEPKEIKDKVLTKFPIAVDREFAKDQTDFFDCDSWGKTAEFLATYCKKGDLVSIVGRLQQDIWEKDGKKQSSVKIVVEKASKLSGGNSNKNVVKDNNFDGGQISVDDIPF